MKTSRNPHILIAVSMLVISIVYVVHFTTSQTTATSHIYPDDFPGGWTLQQAIDSENVSDGDSIIIRPDTYHEHLIINRPLTVESFNRDTTVIDGSGNGTTIEVTSNDVNIYELTVQNGDPYGILLNNTNNVEVSHNIVSYSRWGIKLSNCTHVVMTYNDIKNNTYNFGTSGSVSEFTTCTIDTTNKVDGKSIYYWKNHEHDGETIPAEAGYVAVINSTNVDVRGLNLAKNDKGVFFSHTNDSAIENVSISNCENGIVLSHSNENLIAANSVVSSEYEGIELWSSSNNTMRDNTISDNGMGIDVFFSNNCIIEENTVFGSNSFGIAVGSSDNSRILDNQIYNNNGVENGSIAAAAIGLWSSKGNVIRGNDVSLNGYIGLFLDSTEDNIVNGNTFSKNGHRLLGIDRGFEIYLLSSNHSIFYRNNITPFSSEVTALAGSVRVENSYDIHWNTSLEGNHWSAYLGNDANGDGIGDIPYYVPIYPSSPYFDHHPLMDPWRITRMFGIKRGFNEISNVVTSTNSTVANGITEPSKRDLVNFNHTSMEVTFIITSTENETCTITIAREWFDGPFELQIDDIPLTMNSGDIVQNATHTTIYIVYEAGTHTFQIKGTRLTLVVGDLDNDGDVDIFDIVKAASNYKYRYPP